MLVQFSVKNFQSIKDQVTLDMRKMNIGEHRESLIEDSFLPISVLYGPNGGGKSTVLRALAIFFSNIVEPLRIVSDNSRVVASVLTPVPYLLDKESKQRATEFEIVLKINGTLYRLCMEFLNGKILYESLQEKGGRGKPALLYEREKEKLSIGEKLKEIPVKEMKIADNIPAISSLKLVYNTSPIREITDWIMHCGAIDYSEPSVEEQLKAAVSLSAQREGLRDSMKKLASYLNLGIDDFELEFSDESKRSFRVKTYHKMPDATYPLLLNMESMGTQKIFNLLPFVVSSLQNGTTLIVDELDAKIHPKLLERVIGLFTNKANNPKGAQLLFTSHDLSTMRSEVFRRDEIWFAAKNEEQSSELYSLADLKGQDGEIIRSDASYNKQYLAGRYGADPYFRALTNWEE